jgi:hypothetical protein
MDSPQFLITDYLKNLNDTEEFRNTLFKKGIMTKYYDDEKLLLVYTKFEDTQRMCTDLKNECRSLIIDVEEKQIVSYTCNTPICNLDAMNYLIGHNNKTMKMYKCYEGTLMSLFHNKDKWYLSTRRCLDSKESVFSQNDVDNKSHYDLFVDVIKDDGYDTLDDFTNMLNKDLCYNFVLIHHDNKHIVNYTSQFGDEYKKLCLAFVRNKNSLSEIEYESIEDILKFKEFKNIFVPETISSLEEHMAKINNTSITNDNITNCTDEGILIKLESETNVNTYLKIQTYPYQFNKAIGSEKNIFKGFINLYQNDKLVNYLETNTNLNTFKKIVNPLNIQESYDTIGIVDSLFKVCTSELYELFKLLWNLKTGKHIDTNLYEILPKEYKSILYGIRGIYFKNKSKKYSTDNTVKPIICLQIKDIYQYIKTIDTDVFEQYLRVRKLMSNWVKVNTTDENLKKFNKINDKCDKVNFKLTAIFTNKLFPNIMPDDIPYYDTKKSI